MLVLLGVILQAENGCSAMADSPLVRVPHQTLHGTVSILGQSPAMAANVRQMGAIKNEMPFISQCLSVAQSAAVQMLQRAGGSLA